MNKQKVLPPILGALFLLLLCNFSMAAVFTVNTEVDYEDFNLGDGICAIETGECTLRAAVQEANQGPYVDLIIIPNGTYNLNYGGINEFEAREGDLNISQPLILQGESRENVIIDGGALERVFWVTSEAVFIKNLTIQNALKEGIFALRLPKRGYGTKPEPATYILKNVNIKNNLGNSGANISSSLYSYVIDSIFENNKGTGLQIIKGYTANSLFQNNDGSGIFAREGTFILNSIIKNNLSNGVHTKTASNETGVDGVDISNSLISNNQPVGVYSESRNLRISNSSISGNKGSSGGAAVFTKDVYGLNKTEIINSTISFNDTTNNRNLNYSALSGNISLKNSIISNTINGSNCDGTLQSTLGFNIDDDGSCGFDSLGDKNTDPKLALLADNGGFTPTHALNADSPAIGAASNSSCNELDQRFYLKDTGTCDIGAFQTTGTDEGFINSFTVPSATISINQTAGIYRVDISRAEGSGSAQIAYFLVEDCNNSAQKCGLAFTRWQENVKVLNWNNNDMDSKQIELRPVNYYPLVEDRKIKVILIPLTVGTEINHSEITVSLINNVIVPLAYGDIGIKLENFDVNENIGQVELTIERNNGSDGEVTVDYYTSTKIGSFGAKSVDFTEISGTLTFADGEIYKTISIDITDDTIDEWDESFSFTLSNPTGGAKLDTFKKIGITIIDNDEQPINNETPVEDDIIETPVEEDTTPNNSGTPDGTTSPQEKSVDDAGSNGGALAPWVLLIFVSLLVAFRKKKLV